MILHNQRSSRRKSEHSSFWGLYPSAFCLGCGHPRRGVLSGAQNLLPQLCCRVVLIGIYMLFTLSIFVLNRVWGHHNFLKVLIRYTVLRKLISSNCWVMPFLWLSHTWVNLSYFHSLLVWVIGTSGGAHPFDVALTYADDLVTGILLDWMFF